MHLVFSICLGLSLLVLSCTTANALTCTAATNGGDWSQTTTWNDCGGGIPSADDTANIAGATANVTIGSGLSVEVANVTITNSSTLVNGGTANASATDFLGLMIFYYIPQAR
jgi:hypothetical protein